MKAVTPLVMQSYYYTVFGTEQGNAVLNDIKYLLTGATLDQYEAVDPTLPHHELAAKTATRNAWDCIEGMVAEMPRKKMSLKDLFKETLTLWKRYK